MPVRIIAEVGSTHLGKIELIKEGIEKLADMGVDAVKFQLFPDHMRFTDSGNVYLYPDLFYQAVEIARANALDISASVFDEDSLEILLKIDPQWVKFAYSRHSDLIGIKTVLAQNIEAIVSCDVMTLDKVPKRATKLFCIPQYPVYFNPRFDGLFPLFDGFSDHTLGWDITLEAVKLGAKTIEKHVKLVNEGCPDCAFALTMSEFKEMTREIRRIEN